MPRYLLQQWTAATIRDQESLAGGGHGVELWAAPSSNRRLRELRRGDVVFIAAVVDGRLLPISRLTVRRIASYEDLVAEGHDPYDLPFQAIGDLPLPRMNLREIADRKLSLSIRRADGRPLARRRGDSRRVDGQAFRTPQWIDQPSAEALTTFLNRVWDEDDASGTNDPVRVSRGLATVLTAGERKAVERRAMDVVEQHYRRLGYDVHDASRDGPWDLTATHPDGDEAHIEVKGTTGTGASVTVTAGERRHAREHGHPVFALVSTILLKKGRAPHADGGTLSVLLDPWDVDRGRWATVVYRYEPPSSPRD